MSRRNRQQITMKDDPPEEKDNPISYLQPEILPVQMMKQVLKEKGMSDARLDKADRSDIIGLFYKHISPKHQRELRDNRRGKILKRMRERRERKVEDCSWKKMVVESKGMPPSSLTRSSESSDSTTENDRLKPPPSCINRDRKTIKLGAPKSATGLDFEIKRRNSDDSNGKEAKKVHVDMVNGTKRKSEASEGLESTAVKKLKEEEAEIFGAIETSTVFKDE